MSKYQKLTHNDTTAALTDDDEQHFPIFNSGDSNIHCSPYYDDDHGKSHLQYNDTKNNDVYVNSFTNHSLTDNGIIVNGNNIVDSDNGSSRLKSSSGSSNNLLITALDVDDNTMEIPLLQSNNSNYHNNNNNKDTSEFVCLCQQKGFTCNLNSKSTQTAKSKILWAIGMCCIFMIVEFLGGYIAGSLAIMTDAAHLASDCISFVIGLVAIWLGNKPPDRKMSFGYKRLEVMGALISILSIWILTATLVLVAMQRIFTHDYDLDANTMMTISGIGIVINIIMFFILHTSADSLPIGGIGAAHGHSHSHSQSHSHNHHGHSHSDHSHQSPSLQRHRPNNDNSHWHSEHSTRSVVSTDTLHTDTGTRNINGSVVDIGGTAKSIDVSSGQLQLNGIGLKHQQNGDSINLNLRAATIHVIGDLVQSLGVFIASVLIKIYPGAKLLDPLCTVLFSVIVVMTTVNLFRESMYIIMDSVPQGLSLADLEMDLLGVEGVKAVHYLNVWNHTSDHTILMAHLIIDLLVDSNDVLMKATQLASGPKYNVKHSTIQIERVNS